MRRALLEARAWCHRKRRVYVGVGVGLGGWGGRAARAVQAMGGVGGAGGKSAAMVP